MSYKELHIEYSDPLGIEKPLTLRYKLVQSSILERWIKKLETSIESFPIDDPYRFSGFDDIETEKLKAIKAINHCIDTINDYRPGFVTRRIGSSIDQDTLNYLHHIFEVYHGLLNEPHEFFRGAPHQVQHALGQLNVEVHRCEGLVEGSERIQLPTHCITYYKLKKEETLELEDYKYFEDFTEFGTVYLLYTEIGKTLQDLALDDDHYISDFAYRPFRHYSSDFVVRFYQSSTESWKRLRKLYKEHFDKNKDFFLKKGYDYSHPYNRPGNIPLAKLMPSTIDVVPEIKKRQMVTKVSLY
jgi:hypothetical protein